MKDIYNLKKLFSESFINNKIALIQDEMVVAIGIIINPICLKKIIPML